MRSIRDEQEQAVVTLREIRRYRQTKAPVHIVKPRGPGRAFDEELRRRLLQRRLDGGHPSLYKLAKELQRRRRSKKSFRKLYARVRAADRRLSLRDHLPPLPFRFPP
jgi:hypothetical protein